MEIQNYRPKNTKLTILPWEQHTIIPVGDFQYGALGCSVERFKEFIKEGLKQPNPLFLGMGDYVDVMSPSNRAAWKAAHKYDSVIKTMSDAAEQHVEEVLKILDPTKGLWIGMLEGHHFFDFEDGTTSDTRLCQGLETTFLGDCALITLRFANGHKSIPFKIFAHHGEGGGVSPVSHINKMMPLLGQFDADLFLIGHHHKTGGITRPWLYTTDRTPPTLRHKDRKIHGTGGWLQGYMQGSKKEGRAQGNYPEQRMLGPLSLGGINVILTPRRSDSDGNWVQQQVVD